MLDMVSRVVEELDKESSSKLLQEISLRTGAIAIYLAKVKQYANAVDGGVNKLNHCPQNYNTHLMRKHETEYKVR